MFIDLAEAGGEGDGSEGGCGDGFVGLGDKGDVRMAPLGRVRAGFPVVVVVSEEVVKGIVREVADSPIGNVVSARGGVAGEAGKDGVEFGHRERKVQVGVGGATVLKVRNGRVGDGITEEVLSDGAEKLARGLRMVADELMDAVR